MLEGTVRVVATVKPDLQTIEGTIEAPKNSNLQLVDVLSQLPLPQTDRAQQRTWPAAAESGWIVLGKVRSNGKQDFMSLIPRRYGASGMVPGQGLYVHGLWHPQPVLSTRVPVTRWDVELHLPPNTVGVLNSTVGEGVLRWQGLSDRLSLAVIPNGRARKIETASQPLVIVEGGRRVPSRTERIAQAIPKDWPMAHDEPIVVVMAPMYRRLARPGSGMVFLSQRTTRLTGELWRHHTSAIQRGILSAAVRSPDPWARSLAANHLSDQLPKGPSAEKTLSWLAWVPDIDALLYDGSLPFSSDVMGQIWPSDSVTDDLLEVLENTVPGQVAIRKIAGLVGADKTTRFTQEILKGRAIDDAAKTAGIPPRVIAQWRSGIQAQNLRVKHAVKPTGGAEIELIRDAGPDTPSEPIQIQVNGTQKTWVPGPGAQRKTLEFDTPDQTVHIDPNGEVLQTRRDDDGWPPKWTPTFAFGLSELKLNQTRPSVSLHAWMRRKYGTHWVYGAHAGTNEIDLASGAVSLSRSFGPLTDSRSRAYLVWFSAGGALLDPAFRPTDQGKMSVDSRVVIAWDTYNAWPLPRHGHRMSGSVGMGMVPNSDQRWTTWGTSASGLVPLTPWAGLAGRVRGGMSLGGITHRLRPLGGSGGVQGLSTSAVLGHTTTHASIELRTLPIRRASIPLPLAWGSDLQLTGGLDAGAAWTENGRIHAVGWTAGVAGVADLFGARPSMLGLVAGQPIRTLSGELPDDLETQLYLRVRQSF